MIGFLVDLELGIGLKQKRSSLRRLSNEYVPRMTELIIDPTPSPTFSLLCPCYPTTPTTARIAAITGKHKTTPLAYQALESNWEMVEIHDWPRC
jgi:hypothetical protein